MASVGTIKQKVLDSEQKTYSSGEVRGLLNSITPQYIYYPVTKLRVGDVFMYKVLGGKIRPWVVMVKGKGGMIGAACLTHHSDLAFTYPTKCPYYSESAIGPTLSLFEEEKCLATVLAPYSNKKHLAEVRKDLLSKWL